jgi:hypothetical protein
MGRNYGAKSCKMPFDIGPLKSLIGLFHRHDDSSWGLGTIEDHLTAPNQGGLLPIGVDPQSIATNGDFLGWITRPNCKNPRVKSWQTRDETRVLRMEVFQDDAFVIP